MFFRIFAAYANLPSASKREQEMETADFAHSSIAVHVKRVLHLDQNTTVVSGCILTEKSLR